MRTLGPNIYRYMRGNIQRTSGEIHKYKRLFIHLISPPLNLWWVKNTEFEEIKLMVDASLSLREEIHQLEL
jgi:hypothetical protein